MTFRKLPAIGAATILVLAMSTGTALAGNPSGTGQPSQSCGAEPMAPPGS